MKLRGLTVTALLAASSLFSCSFESRAQGSSEYQVKAAFIYNFVRFVEWPQHGGDNSPFVIGVLGQDPFGAVLDNAINGKSIGGRPMAVKRLGAGQNARECQVLFISSSERKRLPQIVASVRGSNTLTIGEMDQFCQQGGIINFVLEQSKVRFEINAGAAEQAGLKCSSKLLVLAKAVINQRE